MLFFYDLRIPDASYLNDIYAAKMQRCARYTHWYFFRRDENGYIYENGVDEELFKIRLKSRPYDPQLSIGVCDIEPPHDGWGNDMHSEPTGSAEWEYAAQQYIDALQVLRDFYPYRRHGIYDEVPSRGIAWQLRRYWLDPVRYAHYARYEQDWRDKCEKQANGFTNTQKGLADYCDFCCPSFYTGDFAEVDNGTYQTRVDPVVNIIREVYNKPIYPYVMPQGHPYSSNPSAGDLMTGDQWIHFMEMASRGTDGLVIYCMPGAFPQGRQTEWFQATLEWCSARTDARPETDIDCSNITHLPS